MLVRGWRQGGGPQLHAYSLHLQVLVTQHASLIPRFYTSATCSYVQPQYLKQTVDYVRIR